METVLHLLETSAFVIMTVLGVGIATLVISAIGYAIWLTKIPHQSVEDAVKTDFINGRGNGIATDKSRIPMYLGIVGRLEVDQSKEYVLLERGQGWELIERQIPFLWRNPLAPPFYYRRVLKYPPDLTIKTTSQTASKEAWEIEAEVTVRCSIDNTSRNTIETASAAPVRSRLEKEVQGLLIDVIQNTRQESLTKSDNWTNFREDVKYHFQSISGELGLIIDGIPLVNITRDGGLSAIFREEERADIHSTRGLIRSPKEAKRKIILDTAEVRLKDRQALRTFLVDRMTEIAIETVRAGQRIHTKEGLSNLFSHVIDALGNDEYTGLLQELPKPQLEALEGTIPDEAVLSTESFRNLLENSFAAQPLEKAGRIIGVELPNGWEIRVDHSFKEKGIEIVVPGKGAVFYPLPVSSATWPKDVSTNWALLYGIGLVMGLNRSRKAAQSVQQGG
jgi:hypothetical protein